MAMTTSGTVTPSFRHLLRMSDSRGIFEHAKGNVPRRDHGYCTDDNARLLVVACRSDHSTVGSRVLVRLGLSFLSGCQDAAGAVRNRMNQRGVWQDSYAHDDAWGRAMWAFGSVAARGYERWMRDFGSSRFDLGVQGSSTFRRANSFAALGALEIVAADDQHVSARRLLMEVAAELAAMVGRGPWPWPEERLQYANAVFPEVVIGAAAVAGDDEMLDVGLRLLDWLWTTETLRGGASTERLSVTPVGGRGPEDPQPAFDQQPIEVAALAEACARAWATTGDPLWADRLATCAKWFTGTNDGGHSMIDATTGGGYDGLTPRGVNLNQGAESTLAMVSTLSLVGPATESVDGPATR